MDNVKTAQSIETLSADVKVDFDDLAFATDPLPRGIIGSFKSRPRSSPRSPSCNSVDSVEMQRDGKITRLRQVIHSVLRRSFSRTGTKARKLTRIVMNVDSEVRKLTKHMPKVSLDTVSRTFTIDDIFESFNAAETITTWGTQGLRRARCTVRVWSDNDLSMRVMDTLLIVMLVYTSTVTPYEVSAHGTHL
ncbi:hypothetical protein CYMTET_35887 [Cymbomonas tetramitiformis]|uniref:Uncharacterized protein n=1 Tax=Cymbomonas tetramitiformis TaxID=36881 RepID=A0AAE0KNK4_9CHLO|nr:hypothetical protein CYMTET_35887 [Cymbomonas tetramitiformis]